MTDAPRHNCAINKAVYQRTDETEGRAEEEMLIKNSLDAINCNCENLLLEGTEVRSHRHVTLERELARARNARRTPRESPHRAKL